jgi:hypothetical protein
LKVNRRFGGIYHLHIQDRKRIKQDTRVKASGKQSIKVNEWISNWVSEWKIYWLNNLEWIGEIMAFLLILLTLCLTPLSISKIIGLWLRIVEWVMNNGLERMWKNGLWVIKVSAVHIPECTEENCKNLSQDSRCPDRVPNLTPFGLPLEPVCYV